MDSEGRVVRAPSLDASYGFRVLRRCVNSGFLCVKKYLSLQTDADFECCRRAAYVPSVEMLQRFRVSSRESRLHCSSDVKGPSLNAPYGPLVSMHVAIPRVDLRKKI